MWPETRYIDCWPLAFFSLGFCCAVSFSHLIPPGFQKAIALSQKRQQRVEQNAKTVHIEGCSFGDRCRPGRIDRMAKRIRPFIYLASTPMIFFTFAYGPIPRMGVPGRMPSGLTIVVTVTKRSLRRCVL